MANPRKAPTVMASIAAVEADRGQPLERYVIPLDRAKLYRWIPDNEDTADGVRILDHTGGDIGRFHEVRCPDRGADLGDESVTIAVSGDVWRVMPAATLSENRTITLDDEGAVEGDTIEITRLDSTANTLTIANGGAGAGDVFVLPVSERWWCVSYFDGTNWIARAAGQLP